MKNVIEQFIGFLSQHDGINDKAKLAQLAFCRFQLTKDRSVYYCKHFAVRFSSSATSNFGNTVLSLSNLKKVDNLPFFVCLVTPLCNYLFLANSTFLTKISHSSHKLRENNIRGSFNGTDIIRSFEGIQNTPENHERLFNIHFSDSHRGIQAALAGGMPAAFATELQTPGLEIAEGHHQSTG